MKKVKADYGNWVSMRLVQKVLIAFILSLLLVAAASAAASVLGVFGVILKYLFLVIALLALICLIYFLYARQLLADGGGNIQSQVIKLLVSYISWSGEGEALDVGCGSGALTVRLAKKFPKALVTGADSWGKSWDYGQKQCELNAAGAGVGDRTTFMQASASKLPFEDGRFDLVASNLTFHEVKDSEKKLDPVKEALRVLKPGGVFAFQDLFLIEKYYGTPEVLVSALKDMGVSEVHFVHTNKEGFLPKVLKLPFMLGTLGLIYGVK